VVFLWRSWLAIYGGVSLPQQAGGLQWYFSAAAPSQPAAKGSCEGCNVAIPFNDMKL
jgi:hypothetical protein